MSRLFSQMAYRRENKLLDIVIRAHQCRPSAWLISKGSRGGFSLCYRTAPGRSRDWFAPYNIFALASTFYIPFSEECEVANFERQRVRPILRRRAAPTSIVAVATRWDSQGPERCCCPGRSAPCLSDRSQSTRAGDYAEAFRVCQRTLYYINFYHQTWRSQADGEFTALSAAASRLRGPVATRYYTTVLRSSRYCRSRRLSDLASHRCLGEFPNMREMHRRFGFRRFYFVSQL